MSAPAGGDTTRTFNGPSTSGTGGSAGAAAATEGAAFGGTGLAHARTPIMRPTTSVGTHVRARTRGEQGLSSGMAVKVMSCDSPPRLFRLTPNCLRFCRLVYIRDLRAPPAAPPAPVRPAPPPRPRPPRLLRSTLDGQSPSDADGSDHASRRDRIARLRAFGRRAN